MRFRREVVGALGAFVLTACAAAGADSTTPDTAVPSTVGDVGALPASIPVQSEPADTAEPDSSQGTTTSVAADTSAPTTSTTVVGTVAGGNRVLLIGDSILASTSRRYSNDMCEALVPLGWEVEVEAEVSRPISFADTVLDRRFGAGWDAVVIFLGTNYGNDEKDYLRRLNDAIVQVGELPIVLITVTEHDTEVHEVNDTIRAIVDVYPNLSIVDWQQISSAAPELLREDGYHLTDEGRVRLAAAVAEHLGQAPEQPGECLQSSFTDDSAGSVNGSSSSGSGTKPKPTSTTAKPSGTATTVKPGSVTSTTVKPNTGATTSLPTTGSTTATTTAGTTATTTAGTTASTAAPASTSPPTVAPTIAPTVAPTVAPTAAPTTVSP